MSTSTLILSHMGCRCGYQVLPVSGWKWHFNPEVAESKTGPSKVSELQALDLRYQSYHPEGVLFQLPTLGKKMTVRAPPTQLMFEAFPSDCHLCAMKCLWQYETGTLIHRKSDLSSSQPLFLSYHITGKTLCKYGAVFAPYLHDWTPYSINTVQKRVHTYMAFFLCMSNLTNQ